MTQAEAVALFGAIQPRNGRTASEGGGVMGISPIDLNKRIRSTASRTVHNAFHHEARAFALGVGDSHLAHFLQDRIDKLHYLMHENIVE